VGKELYTSLSVPTYCATDQFEGATLATENTLWWWQLWRAETCRRLTKV